MAVLSTEVWVHHQLGATYQIGKSRVERLKWLFKNYLYIEYFDYNSQTKRLHVYLKV